MERCTLLKIGEYNLDTDLKFYVKGFHYSVPNPQATEGFWAKNNSNNNTIILGHRKDYFGKNNTNALWKMDKKGKKGKG